MSKVESYEIMNLVTYLQTFKVPFQFTAYNDRVKVSYPSDSYGNCVCHVIQDSYKGKLNMDWLPELDRESGEYSAGSFVGNLTAEDVATRIINHYWEGNNETGNSEV